MQAIHTRVLPATNTKPTRIKAECARGSITIPASYVEGDEMLGSAAPHARAARKLADSFVTADVVEYGSTVSENPWGGPFATGCLPDGTFAHVFVEPIRMTP